MLYSRCWNELTRNTPVTFSFSYHYIIWNVTSNQALFKVVVLDSWNTHLRMKLQFKVSIFALFYTTLSLPSLKQASKMSAFNKYHGLKHSNSADGRTIRYDSDEEWHLKIFQWLTAFLSKWQFFSKIFRDEKQIMKSQKLFEFYLPEPHREKTIKRIRKEDKQYICVISFLNKAKILLLF